MQVASRDCRILMSGDSLQDVQIDASVGTRRAAGSGVGRFMPPV
jgi:hypothetical protein